MKVYIYYYFIDCIFGNFFNVKEFAQVSNKIIALEMVNCYNLPSTMLTDIIKCSVKLSFLTANCILLLLLYIFVDCQLSVNDVLGLINTIQHLQSQITGLYIDCNMNSIYNRMKVPYPFCGKRKIEKALKECGIFDYRI